MGLLRGFMLKTVVFTLGIGLTGCSVGSVNGGDDTPPSDAGVDPRAATFNTGLRDVVTPKGCVAAAPCHGGTQTPLMMSFEMMTSNTALAAKYLKTPASMNIIITKAADGAVHQGVNYLDATDKATISTWLETPQ